MNTSRAQVSAVVVLVRLLERMDASAQPVDAHQYRVVARRLAELLTDTSTDWEPLLQRSRVAAQTYENAHYATAGLCRSPLEPAMAAEVEARRAIEIARGIPPAGAARSEATAA